MPKNVTILTIFLSCSSEMATDKSLVSNVVLEVNDLLKSSNSSIQYSLWDWKKDSIGGVGADIQSVIDLQIPDHDIYLGFMWKRFGVPTQQYGSGTEHEFRSSLESHKNRLMPKDVLFFFKTSIDSLSDIDADEFLKVIQFKKSLRESGILFHDYASSEEIQKYLRLQLIKIGQGWHEKNIQTLTASGFSIREEVIATSLAASSEKENVGDESFEISWGYLDYAEEFQESMARSSKLMSSLTSAIEHLGASSQSRACEMNDAADRYGKGKVPIAVVRKLTDHVADDMIAFMTLAVPLIDEIETHFNDGFETMLAMLEASISDEDPESYSSEILNLFVILSKLRTTLDESEIGMKSMEMGANSLRRMSARVKKGAQSIGKFVSRYSSMCSSMRSKLENVESLVGGLINTKPVIDV